MAAESANHRRVAPFTEKGFYLSELRDRTIAIAVPAGLLRERTALEPVLKDLEANRTRVILISDGAEALETLAGGEPLDAERLATLPGRVWRRLGQNLRVGVAIEGGAGFGAACCRIVLALGIQKLVWVDAEGGLIRADGERDSFIDAAELRDRIEEAGPGGPHAEILVCAEAMLSAGVAAVNLCTPAGIADELFTYDGSGTLFTREGYVAVRGLGLDDFDAAADLIERGMVEGYLAPRTPEQIERVLESAFGAFIGGNHLAGLGTLLTYEDDRAAEIASLYTLTRFLGEGIGSHLVRFAAERAGERGCRFVFACTTSPRVEAFFERNGFRKVERAEVPEAKWRAYDPTRRAQVKCLRRDL
ncbi:MAG: GNAT family N-acetyltransferase [Deltaproteobacteria bacterium]|jgi:N-acetylglutamate synthase-like GNAT family acetyltransferase|nr:GNAT family N-acetyltransferase [Deltaproteobacteria bacterium]